MLTPEEAAAALKVHRQTIYALLDTGELPGRKIGRQWRISGRALHEYLKGRFRD